MNLLEHKVKSIAGGKGVEITSLWVGKYSLDSHGMGQ